MQLRKIVLAAIAACGFADSAKAEDWTGFYAGVLGEGTFVYIDGATIGVGGLAKVFGYNWDQGDMVFGFDEMLAITPVTSGEATFAWQKMGRVGFEVTESALLYGAAGGGYFWFPDASFSTGYGAVAAGVEVAMGDNAAWRTHAQLSFPFDQSIFSGAPPEIFHGLISVGTGLVWNFN